MRVAPMRLASARNAIRPAIPAPQADARQPCHADALRPHPPAVNARAMARRIARRKAAHDAESYMSILLCLFLPLLLLHL
jgi:hypothetical protein